MSDEPPDRRPLMFPYAVAGLGGAKKLGDTVELLQNRIWGMPDSGGMALAI